MPQEEASIRMTVDNTQALRAQEQYNRVVREQADEYIRQAQTQAKSLQDQIRLLERRIELERQSIRETRESNITEIRELARAGKLPEGRSQEALINEARAEARLSEQQLKDINRLLKQWSTEQLTAQRKTERLSETISEALPRVLGAGSVGGMITGGLGSLMAPLGMLGAVGGILISKTIQGAMTMEPAMRDYARLMGATLMGTRGAVQAAGGMGLSELGLRPSEYFQQYAQLYRAAGGTMRGNALNILAAEQALGLPRQTTTGLLGVERYGGGNIIPVISYFDTYLRNTNQSIALLPEILQTFTSEATAMMRATGRVDTEMIAQSISTVGRAFGLTGEPLNIVYSAMRQGLQQSTNPAIQALQFSAMERAMPGASLWQMQMAMETPWQNPQYVINMLNQLRTMTGGGEMYARTLMNVFGVSANLANQMAQSTITPEMFIQQSFKKEPERDYVKQASELFGAIEKAAASWAGGFEIKGFTGGTQQFVSTVINALEGIGEGIKKVDETIEKFQGGQLAKAAETNSKLEKIWHLILYRLGSPGLP